MSSTNSCLRMTPEPIAVIGSACRFPGGSNNTSKLWDLLEKPRDLLTKVPEDRFNADRFYHQNPLHHGTTNVTKSYFLEEDPRLFDAAFFSIKHVEAHALDPQQRVLMETIYEALETGGLSMESLAGSQTAVYIGLMCGDYSEHLQRDIDALPTYMPTGTARSIMSNRVSYFFDWHGLSMTIDTACSSSLVAVHQAVQLLRSGESHIAVAAGSNLILGPELYIGESKLKMLSPNGRSRMWDVDADGYGRGEGVAAVILKRLSSALTDGDHIECLIRGSGVNQDGRTKGITMPSQVAQTDLIKKTYESVGLDPLDYRQRCQYFEAHGTGTPAGDPKEAEAISKAFFRPVDDASEFSQQKLYVGSIKTVIGHTEGTAGIAGVLKASLAVQHGIIPPNLLFNKLNPDIEPFYTNLEVPTTAIAWPEIPRGSPRRASVNSFGFGGTNAHVIIESYSPAENSETAGVVQFTPFVFSASSEKALRSMLCAFADYLDLNPDVNLHHLSRTLQARRTAHTFRISVSAQSVDTLRRELRELTESATTNGVQNYGVRSRATSGAPVILGVFTGQGAQWITMGQELISRSPFARALIQRMDGALQTLPESQRPRWLIIDELMAGEPISRLNTAMISQPLCTAIQIVLFQLLQEAGVKLSAVVGHSSGEIAAAYAAGFISRDDAIKIAYLRGFFSDPAGIDHPGAMMAVGTSLDDANELCSLPTFEGRLSVAAVNSPSSITLSGDHDAVVEAKEVFDDEKVFARILKVDKAYHSHHMVSCSTAYVSALKQSCIQLGEGNGCAWFSSTIKDTKMTALKSLTDTYWGENMVRPVLFQQSIAAATADQGPFHIGIEFGPHPTLKGPVLQCVQNAQKHELPYTGLLSRGRDDVQAFSEALGYLWTQCDPPIIRLDGMNSLMSGVEMDQGRPIRDLPSYPWSHDTIFWHESRISKAFRYQKETPHSLLGTKTVGGMKEELRWRNMLRVPELPWINDHRIQGQMVYPAAAYLSTAIEAARSLSTERSIRSIEIEDFEIGKPIIFDSDESIVEAVLTLGNISQDYDDNISASFIFHASTTALTEAMTTHATGRILVTLGETLSDYLGPPDSEPPNIVPIDEAQFYTFLENLGYGYTGDFRSLSSLRRRRDFGTASLKVPQADTGPSSLLLHPALLDSALQVIFLAYCWPNDGSLERLHVPVGIRRLRIDVGKAYEALTTSTEVSLASYLTENPLITTQILADVDIFTRDRVNKLVQIEGVKVVPLVEPTAEADRMMFSEHVWGPISPDCELAFGDTQPSTQDYELATAMERVSIYYMKRLDTLLDAQKRMTLDLEWHFVCMLRFISHVLDSVKEGVLPYAKREWLNDTWDDIVRVKSKWDDRIEMKLVCAVGENLPAAVRRETTMLEHLLADNMLNQFYEEAMGPKEATRFLAKTVAQLIHCHPRMKILEIGAGTGGATKAIIKTIDRSFESYTFTDISTGFFETAQNVFSAIASKMIFKALDIEKDVVEQGYAEHSYDLIIGSLVLHATSDLRKTLQNTRRLLKPGGYLMITEITNNDFIRAGFSMSGLPGWWLGQDDGRTLSPCVSSSEWHQLLLSSGFSGVDTMTPEINTLTHPMAVLVSQAVDDQINLLREPLLPANSRLELDQWDLVIIGGSSMRTIPVIEQITRLAQQTCITVSVFASIEFVDSSRISPASAVLCLSELDTPMFENMTNHALEGMKRTFETSPTILWVTRGSGAEEPLMNMTVGLGRSLVLEISDLCLQFLDLETNTKPNAHLLLESLMRLHIRNRWEKDGSFYNTLWTREQEVIYRDGRLLVPRLYFSHARNDRYNASKRPITASVDTAACPVQLEQTASSYQLNSNTHLGAHLITPPAYMNESQVLIKVQSSILLPIAVVKQKQIFCVQGTRVDDGTQVIAFASTNGSFVLAESQRVFTSQQHWKAAAQLLPVLDICFLVDKILAICESDSVLLVHEPPDGIVVLLTESATKNDIRVVCTTSHGDAVDKTWLRLGSEPAKRTIKSLLPAQVSTFIDFSMSTKDRRVAENIMRCLPSACACIHIRDVQSHSSYDRLPEKDLTIKLETIVGRAVEASCATNSSAQRIAVEDLTQLPLEDLADSVLVQWDHGRTIATRVRSLEQEMHFHQDKTYVLFGLSSDLAQSLCEWMVSHGARNIVLTSRTPRLDDRWKSELGAKGARIEAISNDITDKSALAEIVSYIRQNFPPIAGIAHGAMVLDDTSFFEMSLEQMQTVLRPKVLGAIHLNDLFLEDALDFFIFFSSVAAIVGNRGQSAYSAANMFMASLAAKRRAKGLAASILHIGAVIGVGYVTRELTDTPFVTIRKAGFQWMSERDFHLCFAEAILASSSSSGENFEVVTGIDTVTSSDTSLPPWAKLSRFQHCMQESTTKDGTEHRKISVISTKAQLLTATTADDVVRILKDGLFLKLQVALQLPAETNQQALFSSGADELGVDSLIAVKVRSWFLKELDIDMPILKILSGGSMDELIQYAAEKVPADLNPKLDFITVPDRSSVNQDQKASYLPLENGSTTDSEDSLRALRTSMSEESTESERVSTPDSTEVPSSSFRRILPLSAGQARFWFLKHVITDQTASNITAAVTIQGSIRLDDLESAIRIVAHRHESLCSCFFADENAVPMQGISNQSLLRLEKFSIIDEAEMTAQFESLKNYVYEIEKGETMRIIHLALTPNSGYLLLGCHHINMDGVSLEIFLSDLEKAYNKEPLVEPVYQYTDFVLQQSEQLEGDDMKEELDFWRQEFPDNPTPLPVLPFALKTSRAALEQYDYSIHTRRLSPGLAMQIKGFCQMQRVNFFQFYLSVFEVALFKLLGVADLCIGMADANRLDEKASRSIGMYLNLLPLRFALAANQTFEEVLKATKKKVYLAMAHSKVPFNAILAQVKAPRSTSYSPLFQAFINFRRGVSERRKFGSAIGTTKELAVARTPYDITLDIMDNPGSETRITFLLQSQLYSESDANQFGDIYFDLLKRLSSSSQATLATFALFSDESISEAVTIGRGPTFVPKHPATLAHRIRDLSLHQPESVAIQEISGQPWHYSQIHEEVNKIVAELLLLEIAPKSCIAVLLEPSASYNFALLAILHIGAVYVPFDLNVPNSRLATLAKTCSCSAVIVSGSTRSNTEKMALSTDTIIVDLSKLRSTNKAAVPITAQSHDPAMMLFTSGTTGIPKAVVLSHRGLMNHAEAVKNTHRVGMETVLQQSAYSFDLSIYQIILALANGGRLIIVPNDLRKDPTAVAKIVTEHKVTHTIGTPSEYASWFRHGLDHLSKSKYWKFAQAGGEPFPGALLVEFQKISRHFGQNFKFFNIYGPCETTLSSHQTVLSLECSPTEQLSVGKPLPNYSVVIVDKSMKPLPLGYLGEICIGGAGVALGYHELSEETRRKFVNDPFTSTFFEQNGWTSMYRTGDRGLLRSDGSLEVRGRIDGDRQIKLRGIRIELEEIEHTILKTANGELSEVVVVLRTESEILVSYAVFGPESRVEDQTLFLQRLTTSLPLPPYMKPAAIIPVESLPLTEHGKTDRRALEQVPLTKAFPSTTSSLPLTSIETELSLIWKEALPPGLNDVSNFGAASDFFSVGGNSLLIIKLRELIKDRFDVALSIIQLFENSTLAAMGAAIQSSSDQKKVSIDWDSETQLPVDILNTKKMPRNDRDKAKSIVLTGSTGFLGKQLLRVLAESPQVEKIHCIAVRSGAKLKEFSSGKVEIHPGDLTRPLCGLSQPQVKYIFDAADAVIHNGAEVSFLKSYNTLRPANVSSTKQLAMLCLPRQIPIHFISSAAMGQFNDTDTLEPLSVKDFPPPADFFDAYAATKWVSEVFLEKLNTQGGLPVFIHRPSSILGEGADDFDIMSNVMKYAPLINAMPDPGKWKGYLDMISVDNVASGIAVTVLETAFADCVRNVHYVHHSGDFQVPVQSMREMLDHNVGDDLALIPISEWLERAKEHGMNALVAEFLTTLDVDGKIIGQRLVK